MQQIQNILSKIQHLANMPQWSAIDKDLTLQLIRDLYDNVLVINEFNKPITSEDNTIEHLLDEYDQAMKASHSNNANNIGIHISEEDFNIQPIVNATDANFLAEVQPFDDIKIITPNDFSGLDEEISSAFESDELDTTTESPTIAPNVANLTIADIENSFNQEIDALPRVHNAISIEYPQPKNMPNDTIIAAPSDKTLINEESDDDAFYEKLKHLSKPKPTIGQSFIPPTHVKQKDIRNAIGLNDKYLFLNELFHNNKEAYDLAISKINNMESYETAKSWVDENLQQNLQWERNDSTVITFYGLLEKHFNLI